MPPVADGPDAGRVLWVTAEPPTVRGGGGNIRQAHLLGALARRLPTDLIVVGGDTDAALRAHLGTVQEIPAPERTFPRGGRPGRRVYDLRRALDPTVATEEQDWAPARRALRGPLGGRGDYSAVVVEHTGLHPLARLRRPGERWILGTQNVQSVSEAQAADRLRGRRAWLARRLAAQARRFERHAADGFDTVVAVSDEDAAALPFPTFVVPNGVDLAAFSPAPLPPGRRVLFSGSMGYRPNVDGARWFCEEIWPRVRDAVPDAELWLVGRDPDDLVRSLASRPGVKVAWNVPSVHDYLVTARAAIVPLREGSGTRLKALEAFATGRPVVGTRVGLAGLGVVDGVHALIRDEAAAFASAVSLVLTDDALVTDLVEHGRTLAQGYGWDAMFARFALATGLGAGLKGGD